MDSIRRYYLEEVVNLHNSDSFDSARLSLKLEEIRQNLRKRFNWDGDLAFFPNSYYAKRTIFENFKDRRMFANEINFHTMSGFDFIEVSKLDQLDYTGELFVFWRGFFDHKQKPKDCFVFLEVNWDDYCLEGADAFVTNPMDGVTILGFRGSIKPIYLGSNAIAKLDRKQFEMTSGISRFECGTQNYALLLFLESFFEK